MKRNFAFAAIFWLALGLASAMPPVTTLYSGEFSRAVSIPIVERVTFHAPVAGPASLQMLNGGQDSAAPRISSATLTLNGQVVVSPQAFHQKVMELVVPVWLVSGQNTLTVEVRSIPGGKMAVRITAPADAIEISPVPTPVNVGDSIWVQAKVTALGAPVPDTLVSFSVSGIDGVSATKTYTDSAGIARTELTGFVNPGAGTLTAVVEGVVPPLLDQTPIEVVQAGSIFDRARGTITPGGGQIHLPSVAAIEFPEDLARPGMEVILDQIATPEAALDFERFLQAEALPNVWAGYFLKITASSGFPGQFAIRAHVPDSVLSMLSDGYEPELYAQEIQRGANGETISEMIPLNARYMAGKKELVASLSSRYFEPVPASAEPERSMLRTAALSGPLGVVAVLYVSVRGQPSPVTVTGTILRPRGPIEEASVRDTLYLEANLTARTPGYLGWPIVPAPPTVISEFGQRQWRDNNGDGTLDIEYHKGIDIRAAAGTPVYAAGSGIVETIGLQRAGDVTYGAGYRIWIRHADGSRTGYFHLKNESSQVSKGQTVQAGALIALSGDTGYVEGPHLHFEYQDASGVAMDPLPWLMGVATAAEDYAKKLSVMTFINGLPMTGTYRPWAIEGWPDYQFHYNESINLSSYGFETGQEYPLQMKVIHDGGQTATIYDGTLKLKSTALRVVMRWDTAGTDVDLHVTDSKGNHSWYLYLCEIPGGCLDHDDIDGFGPETFSLMKMELDTYYTVQIHYFSDQGRGPTTVQVEVWVDDLKVNESSYFLTNDSWATVGSFSNTGMVQPSFLNNALIVLPGAPNITREFVPKRR